MRSIGNLLVSADTTIREVAEIINANEEKIAIVIDKENKFLGTVTDGDIRRNILKGISIDKKVELIYCRGAYTCSLYDDRCQILERAKERNIYQVPVVNNNKEVEGIYLFDELALPKEKKNKVILMVGGLGTRLKPLTDNTPKPMLNVGEKPILQTIIEGFVKYGYVNIIMCVNYKAHLIQDYFGDGSSFGAEIDYVFEENRMGTAGALTLLKARPSEPFFVMNGDLLTKVNFESLNDYHRFHSAIATMCVREYDFQVPYGVVKVDGDSILSIQEKPVHRFYASAGIYMLSPEAIDYIPKNQFYDMPTLFENLINARKKTLPFPLKEYWLDIGRIDEYKKANYEYGEIFK